MENKINTGRVLLGGIVGGIAMMIIGALIHGGMLGDYYLELQNKGIIKPMEEAGTEWMHHVYLVLTGIPLALLYVFSRKHFGPGPKAALIVGLLVGLIGIAGGGFAMYCFYNVGQAVPFWTGVDVLVESIVCTLIAGALYKD